MDAARMHRQRVGLALIAIGLAGFIPMILTAIMSPAWRHEAAIGTLLFWIVWFIGKTLLKKARLVE